MASVSITPQRDSSTDMVGVAMTTQEPSAVAGGAKPVFGFEPVETQCPMCSQSIVTEISHVRGKASRFFCIYLAVCGIFMPLILLFGLCLLPLYCKSCQDVRHSCPQCKQPLQLAERPLKNRKRYR